MQDRYSGHGSSSPSPKRQRMSSPTYDEQMDFPSQEQLQGVDELEITMSQAPAAALKSASHYRPHTGPSACGHHMGSSQERNNAVDAMPHKQASAFAPASSILPTRAAQTLQSSPDSDNPFISGASSFKGFASALSAHPRKRHRSIELPSTPDNDLAENGENTAVIGGASIEPPLVGFTSAAAVASRLSYVSRSPSPDAEEPQEKDYSAWFSSTAPPIGPIGFTNAIAALDPSSIPANHSLGFTTAREKVIIPSAAALKVAEERMKLWVAEEENLAGPSRSTPEPEAPLKPSTVTSPSRKALGAGGNSFSQVQTRPASQTPAPALFTSSRAVLQTPNASGTKGKSTVKAFKSPLTRGPAAPLSAPAYMNSPLNPNPISHLAEAGTSTPARPFRPLIPTAAFATPLRQAAFSTPPRALGITPLRKGAGPKKFVTPFKSGMRPGEPGRSQLEEKIRSERAAVAVAVASVDHAPTPSGSREKVVVGRTKYFNLTPPKGRKSLVNSGLWPQAHSGVELVELGINLDELENITPETAIYYSFKAPSTESSSTQSSASMRSSVEALQELQKIGCSLATQEWVDNHWRLILWKLAGMVCLNPNRESAEDQKQWCWGEITRQLRYRYERELNGGSRPALRLITTQDAPANSHLILCISNIFWSEGGIGEDGLPIIPHPELEITDGWYRLRAEIDEPLARATRKGHLRVGRKIAVAGAKLSRDSDACEVLEAYGKVKLVLSGNSSHLAPWHAKLGFQSRPAIATLNSLTADGGIVHQLDLVVHKLYPIAFIEFLEDENGEKRREGPRKEKEEMKLHEQWMRRREKEEERLRRDFEDKFHFYDEWADRLERKVGTNFIPKDTDVSPPQVEDIFEQLNTSANFKIATNGISINVAGWLARYLREQIARLHETMQSDIERDLQELVPPRDVRSFRVLFMKDAVTSRKPANRVVEVTVWDVLSLTFDESSKPGSFKEGQHFLVTNLVPSQKTAWMDTAADSHIYLSTGHGSRWTKLPAQRGEEIR